ncbi:hydrolase [Halobacillus andaensis]|uniref:Hydrolase n=1 Tax=Halobacillus andaensis TaxID=1176239 RepID=A0A917B185_HALAA|nr:PHB depolymerase family esterase [Halobacillus andaensis]MBP2003904.1 polyhydroxybutyrate depolymerase [Halobacillus andaensis]GGF14164.1 hydrolase [Halobacillus andaensis]
MKSHVQVAIDTIPSKDGERSFYYTLPSAQGGLIPLVFCFHGAGSSARHHMGLTHFHELSEEENACFVFPEALQLDSEDPMSKQFNEGRHKNAAYQHEVDDVGFVMRMIDYFRSLTTIDEERIYVTGFSNGSAFSIKMAIEYPELFAGVGGVAGPAVKEVAEKASWAESMPLIFFMGEDDPVVPYDGKEDPGFLIDQLLSAEQTVMLFARSLPFPVEEEIAKDGSITRRRFYSRDHSNEVVFYSMKDTGHTWPGGPVKQENWQAGKVCRELNATNVMWEFLKKHARKRLGHK